MSSVRVVDALGNGFDMHACTGHFHSGGSPEREQALPVLSDELPQTREKQRQLVLRKAPHSAQIYGVVATRKHIAEVDYIAKLWNPRCCPWKLLAGR